MRHQDRITEATVERICAHGPFRGAQVAEVVPLHQRSLCFRLRFTDERSVFVKRALPGSQTQDAVTNEGAVLAALADLPLPAPKLLARLDDPAVLVTQDVGGHGSLDDRRQETGGTSPAWARAVARGLAAVHGTHDTGRLRESNPVATLLTAWTVVGPADVTRYAGGYAEALRLLRHTGLVDDLRDTAAGWRATGLIHGDVKHDNVLCGAAPDGPGALHLVDWEAGGLGDPRWDVGCLIGDLLFVWLSGIDLDAGPTLDDWIAAADPPFAAVQRDIAAAAGEYESAAPVTDADRRQWLRYAAFFLLQRLCASAVHAPLLPPRSLAYLQVAEQLLRRPDDCGELLLCP